RDLLHIVVDLFRSTRLLGGGGGNVRDHFAHLLGHVNDLLQRITSFRGRGHALFHLLGAFLHGSDGGLCLVLNVFDHLRDFLGRSGGAPGQFANFISDNRETAPLFAGASSFDRGV